MFYIIMSVSVCFHTAQPIYLYLIPDLSDEIFQFFLQFLSCKEDAAFYCAEG